MLSLLGTWIPSLVGPGAEIPQEEEKKKKDTSKKTEIRGFERREDLEEVAFLYKNLREETMGVSRGE